MTDRVILPQDLQRHPCALCSAKAVCISNGICSLTGNMLHVKSPTARLSQSQPEMQSLPHVRLASRSHNLSKDGLVTPDGEEVSYFRTRPNYYQASIKGAVTGHLEAPPDLSHLSLKDAVVQGSATGRISFNPPVHFLKTWPQYYRAVLHEEKGFELRLNDRDFKVGDILVLEEWDNRSVDGPNGEELGCPGYSGFSVVRVVTYILDGADAPGGMLHGYVIMSLRQPTAVEMLHARKVQDERKGGE